MAKVSFKNKNNIPEVAETPGYKTPTPVVSDKGVSGTKVPVKKVSNSAVKTKLRSNAVGGKIGGSVKPVAKPLMTAKTTKATKINPPAGKVVTMPKKSAGVTKPIANPKPVYETPGFKPAKKTSKK